VAFGMSSQSNQDDYRNAVHLRDMNDVNSAIALNNRAQTQALIADVAYGVGAAALAVGVTWLVLDLTSNDGADGTRATLAPFGGSHQLGLAVQGQFARNAW
jgi:hypothetical protein